MEAPEKIYLNPLLMEDGKSIVRRCTFERQRNSQVEYIRTDAIIEKVKKAMVEWAGTYVSKTGKGVKERKALAVDLLRYFEEYMGESKTI